MYILIRTDTQIGSPCYTDKNIYQCGILSGIHSSMHVYRFGIGYVHNNVSYDTMS